jgi:AraC family transcriptional regulator of adaptative response / DNA-3-methyladenine glycosylase II
MERSRLVVRVPLAFAADVSDIVARVRAMFDVDADVTEIERHLGTDPRLARLLRHRSGLRVPGAWDRFELAVRAVLGQAISVRAATTMAGRLARVFGEPLPAVDESGLRRLFPTAAILAEADLSTIGITHGRAEAIRQLAIQIKEGTLDLEAPAPVEVMLDKLMKIPGIGEWTAQYIALRACREPDAWPAADLGLRRALANAGPLPSPRRVEQRSQRWRPWRAYAAMHLWINEGRVAARTRKRSTGSRRERS